MILLAACAGPGTEGALVDVGAFAGLGAGRAWTWRDDGVTDAPPDAASLLHGQEDGGIDLRRGERWDDAEEAGHLGLRLEDGLWLDGWAVGDAGDPRTWRLADDPSAEAATVAHDGLACTLARGEPWVAWYAAFDPVVTVTCEDGPALVFAEGFGLVAFAASGVGLDLVAPY